MRDKATFLIMCVDGHLDPHWSDWFEGLTMSHLPDGSTELSGTVTDQAAMYGLLNRARDLGLTLLTVSMTPAAAEGSDSD